MESTGSSTRLLTDAQLLAQCRKDQHRGSGPGGQKRNKTSNAIRLTHLPSGLHVVAGESRTLTENNLNAVRRMRIKLACELREPVDAEHFEPPDWFLEVRHNKQIDASHRHPYYASIGGLILDLLETMQGNVAHVGVMLGINTTSVVKFLEKEPHFWASANRIRTELGMKALTHRG